jgi:glycosyltransferase involved in cell wall biosynthesis
MKVRVLTTSDFPIHGAPESFVRMMALGLDKKGVNVDIIRFWGNRYRCVNSTQIDVSEYLFSVPHSGSIPKVFEFFSQLVYIPIFLLRTKFRDPSAILVLYGLDHAFFVFPFSIICRILHIKCFRVITELYARSTSTQSSLLRRIVHHSNYWQMKYFDRFLSGVVVLSEYLRSLSIKNGVEDRRILLLRHFISIPLSVDKKCDMSGEFIVGYCGTVTAENGVIDLIDAMSLLWAEGVPAKLLIIGKANQDVLFKIDSCKSSGDKKYSITVTGHVAPTVVEDLLNRCAVLVNPRGSGIAADSGFPTKVGEYLATGLPVITTKVGELGQSLCDRNQVVFAEPDDPVSLQDALRFVWLNPLEAAKIGFAGRVWAKNNLEYKANAETLATFLDTVPV